MSRKEWALITLVLGLGGLWVVFFSGWFAPRVIRVEHSVRSLRDAYGPGGRRVDATGKQQLGNVSFSLHRNYRLTSVKVVLAADARTNKYPHALWQLAAKSGSTPIDGFAYGLPVAGMTPEMNGSEPEPLEPGGEYRLLLEARSWKGEHDFTIPPATRAAR